MRNFATTLLVIIALAGACGAAGLGILAKADRDQRIAEQAELNRIAHRLFHAADRGGLRSPCGRGRCVLAGGGR